MEAINNWELDDLAHLRWMDRPAIG